MLKDYYRLAKPGIIYGNGITTVAAFLYASQWQFSAAAFFVLFIPTLLGISLVIGSACVFNNYLDRDMDAKMDRTKKRALVTGAIPIHNALRFGAALGIVGFGLLISFVNVLTAEIALVGFISYVALYTAMKRHTHWAAVVGTIPGAVPIVVGYTAVTGRLDVTALILFSILACWQLPHFYSIALFRKDEYATAGIPVLSVAKGTRITKWFILFFTVGYLVAVTSFFIRGHAGYTYFIVTAGFGLLWLIESARGFTATNDVLWARKLFRFSLLVLLSFCVVLGLAPLLP
jgi:protoheme IX farnesyltransferase